MLPSGSCQVGPPRKPGIPECREHPNYAADLEKVRAAASDAGRDPLSITAADMFFVMTGRSRYEVDEALGSRVMKAFALNISVPADLAHQDGLDELEQQTRHLDVGLIILSAGFATSGPFADTPLAAELEMVCLNVIAVTRLAHTFARQMADNGRGGIMLLGSILGRQGVPWVSCYAAAKAYVRILAEGLHHELKPRGIDVLSVEGTRS